MTRNIRSSRSQNFRDRLRQLRGNRSAFWVEQETDISRANLRRYEKGELFPTERTLETLARFYGVAYEELRLLCFRDKFIQNRENREILLEWASEETAREFGQW